MLQCGRAVLWAAAMVMAGCSDGPTQPRLSVAPLETVPYEALGGGKLTFYRVWMGPEPAAANAFYTIDADAHTTTSLGVDTDDVYLVAPDGSAAATLAFDLLEADRLFVLPLDGSANPRARQIAAFDEWTEALTWTRDSQRLILRQETAWGSEQIVSLRPTRTDQDLRVIWEGTGDCTRSPASATGPMFPGAGNDLLFICADSAVYLLPAGTTTARRIYKPAVPTAGIPPRIVDVAWSPAGDRIAVMIQNHVSLFQYDMSIRIVSLDGTAGPDLHTIRASQEYSLGLCWMAHGETLVFAAGSPDVHVFAVPATGGTPVQLTSAPGALDLALVCRA